MAFELVRNRVHGWGLLVFGTDHLVSGYGCRIASSEIKRSKPAKIYKPITTSSSKPELSLHGGMRLKLGSVRPFFRSR